MSEVNKDASLLPNSTLGYQIYENAYNAVGTSFGTISVLFAGQGNPVNYHCGRNRKLMAIIGGLTFQNTNQMPHILHIYKMPQVCIVVYPRGSQTHFLKLHSVKLRPLGLTRLNKSFPLSAI